MVLFVRGASNRYKDWGTENYLNLARELKVRGFEILFLLGPKENDYADEIEAAGFDCVSGLDFGEIADIMNNNPASHTRCVISNDTGLMHFACALDVPSITISPDETHFTWFPYGKERHAACYPECSRIGCFSSCKEASSCISKVTVQDVLRRFDSLVGN